MRQLNKLQVILLLAGAVLMTIGACSYAVMWLQKVMCWVFLAGALLFIAMQVQQKYEGTNFVIRRLRRILFVSHAFFVVAALSMIDSQYHFLRPLFSSQSDYIIYAYNKWVAFMLAGALIQLYTTHRISSELKKES